MLYWTQKMEDTFQRSIEALTNSGEVPTLVELRIAQLRKWKREAQTAHSRLMGAMTFALETEEERVLAQPNVSLTCMLQTAGIQLQHDEDQQGNMY